jgi:hypothetical protein
LGKDASVISDKDLKQWNVDAHYMAEEVEALKNDPTMAHIKTVLELWMIILTRQMALIEELKGKDASPKRIVDL